MGLKYLVISDVHLGHKRTSTDFIINNLKDFLSIELLEKVDILFIAGDFFDRLLTLHTPETYEIITFMQILFNRLHNANTALRVLKGTQSHDYDQNTLFKTVYECVSKDKNIDFSYIDTLSIESYLGKYDILYLPDEWRPDSTLVMKDIKNLLKTHKLEKVDLIIMHGMFSFQIPPNLHSPLIHKELEFLDICRYYIHPGHIHVSVNFDRILGQGSFDRLAHNEEQAKGGYLCEIGEDKCSYEFIENKNAKKYITLTVTNKSVDDVLLRLSKISTKLPAGTYIRLKAKQTDDAITYIKKIQERFINFTITTKVIDKKEETLVETAKSLYKPITINKDNISILLKDIYSKKETIEPSKQQKLDRFIDTLLKDI